jgi:hypothetical protein
VIVGGKRRRAQAHGVDVKQQFPLECLYVSCVVGPVTCAAGGAPVLRLQAEKKVFSRQGVADISTADAAARLVCLSEEGQVRHALGEGL